MTLLASALVTRAMLESFELGTGHDGDTLDLMINAVSEAMARIAGRTFQYEEDIVDNVAGYGTAQLIVPRAPIVSVTSVQLMGTGGDVVDSIASSAFLLDRNGRSGVLYRPDGWNNTTPLRGGVGRYIAAGSEATLYRVTYNAGFLTPNQDAVDFTEGASALPLPTDLQLACLRGATYLYAQKGRDMSIMSKSTEGVSISYRLPNSIIGLAAGLLPPEVSGVAASYFRGI